MSTITGCPHLLVSFWPMVRAATSLGPPAANPTSRRMGLFGYCCANATHVVAMNDATINAQRCVEVLMPAVPTCPMSAPIGNENASTQVHLLSLNARDSYAQNCAARLPYVAPLTTPAA